MNLQNTLSEEGNNSNREVAKRRALLAKIYEALPLYGSAAFWRAVEESARDAPLPLEVLVKCTRLAISQGDSEGRNRIIEVIIRRTSSNNEYWANNVLKSVHLSVDEREALRGDLYADLYERIIRALIDPKRLFWEENFMHCMRFERQHVYSACMRREGRWSQPDEESAESFGGTRRIPRRLIESINQPVQLADNEVWEANIEDEQAQLALLAVENDEFAHLILQLPEKLKAVVWLIFWEGRTEKDTAKVLGITDRTVRNRLGQALRVLREALDSDSGGFIPAKGRI